MQSQEKTAHEKRLYAYDKKKISDDQELVQSEPNRVLRITTITHTVIYCTGIEDGLFTLKCSTYDPHQENMSL